jgi:pimeloyl-ACP methyl ester carboxylesterase
VFAPIYQIANSHMLRGNVPWLSQHFRVVVMDLRGNGRSDRPQDPASYSFDHYYGDFVAVLDRLEVDRAAVVGISATAMCCIRLAVEQPQRVSHVITAGGWVSMSRDSPLIQQRQASLEKMRRDWAGFADGFFGTVFTEPHSTKPFEDAVLRNAGATEGVTNAMGLAGWFGTDMREACRRCARPRWCCTATATASRRSSRRSGWPTPSPARACRSSAAAGT